MAYIVLVGQAGVAARFGKCGRQGCKGTGLPGECNRGVFQAVFSWARGASGATLVYPQRNAVLQAK